MNNVLDNKMRKNFIWNMIGTTFNAFTSLLFMIVVTRINGVSESGVFTLAFSLACLFCIIGGYAGRVFQVTDVSNEFNDKEYIFHRVITCVIMMIIVCIYIIIKNYSFDKFLITITLCLMKCMEVLADVFYGILQKNEKLYIVGKSLFIKSLSSITLFVLIDYIFDNLLFACIILDIIWFFFLLFYDIPNAKKFINSNERVNLRKVLKLFKSGFFAFSVLFLSIYLINAPKYALDGRVSESLQAIYGIILMPATIISLCMQYLLQPYLNQISSKYITGDKSGFKKIIRTLVFAISGFSFFCLIAAFFAGIPILSFLYAVELDNYLICLLIIIIGASFYSISTLLSAALTTLRHTFVQFIVYAISSVIGFLISLILIENYSIQGASYAYMLIMLIQLFLYIASYFYILKITEFKKRGM